MNNPNRSRRSERNIRCGTAVRAVRSTLAFALVVSALRFATAGIPEPGITLYGSVSDGTSRLTAGRIIWTYTPQAGGDAVTIGAELRDIDGTFSYVVKVPAESAIPDSPLSVGVLPVTATPATYDRSATVDGVGATIVATGQMSEMTTFSAAERGKIERVDLSVIGIMPPDPPSTPQPADGASDFPIANAMLDWADAARASSYDLFLWPMGAGKPSMPTAVGLVTSDYPVPPGDIAFDTAYMWQAIAKNSAGEAAGPEWSFTTLAPPPGSVVITQQPQSQSVCSGDTIQFMVAATGDAPLDYQWQRDGTNIPGAASATYTIASTGLPDEGSYRCLVNNVFGTVASESAMLTVLEPPIITQQPRGQSVCPGDPVTLMVAAEGGAPFQYQWMKDGGAIAGATMNVYMIASFQTADAGSYTCEVSNTCGTVLSDAAVLDAAEQPMIVQNPQDQTATEGTTANFTVQATGGSLAYQWRMDGAPLTDDARISGATEAALSIANAQDADEGQYDCVVTNCVGVVTSAAATLTVEPASTLARFASSSSSVGETESMTSIEVILTSPSTEQVTVEYSVVGGTATRDSDYTLTDGQLTFSPSDTSESINVMVIDDSEPEGRETVLLELSNPVNAGLGVPSMHELRIRDDELSAVAGLRINSWNLTLKPGNAEKGKMNFAGEFNDPDRDVVLPGDVLFEFDNGAISELFAGGSFRQKRGAKFVYNDGTRKGTVLHRIGASSRSKFSLRTKGDLDALRAISPMRLDVQSAAFANDVSIRPQFKGHGGQKGSKFKIGREVYEGSGVFVDSILVRLKRPRTTVDKDSVRLAVRLFGDEPFRPETDTLTIDLGFITLTIQSSEWTQKGANFKAKQSIGTRGSATIKYNMKRRTISVNAKKLTLDETMVSTDAQLLLSYGTLSSISTLILQQKTTPGKETFRY